MQTNSKIRNLRIAVFMLLALNLATIATIVYHNRQEGKEIDNIVISPGTQPVNGRYFRQHLGFDNNQMQVFRDANQRFRRSANDLIGNINRQKELLFIELQSAEPDPDKIRAISEQIGLKHAQLKEATAEFYITVNAVCNAEQKEKMKTLFVPLFQETPNTGAGHGNGNGYRHGRHFSNNQ